MKSWLKIFGSITGVLLIAFSSLPAQVPDSVGAALSRVMRITENPDPASLDAVAQMAIGGLDLNKNGRREFLYVTDETLTGGRQLRPGGYSLFLYEYNPTNATYGLLWKYIIRDTVGGSFPVFTIGDLNGNGNKEIILGVQYAANRPIPGANPDRLLVFEFGTGPLPTEPIASWTFDAPAGSDTRPSALIAGDIDGDGQDEIAVAFRAWSGATKGMIIASVDGAFAGPLTTWRKEVYDTTITTGTIFGTARITDIDNDGRKEATFAFSNGRVYIYETTAANTYARFFWDLTRGTPLPTGTILSFQQVDVNRDGRNEFFLGRQTAPADLFVISGIASLEGYDSTKVARVGRISNHPLSAITEFRGLTAGDFDGNGRVDLFMNNGGRVWRVEYKGTGSITDSVNYTWTIAYQDTTSGDRFRWVSFTGDVWSLSQGITAIDMDGDGKRELLMANQRGGSPTTGSSKLVILESDVVSSVAIGDDGEVLRTYRLHQNYPNPFNPATTIEFELSAPDNVTLEVFDIVGRKVATLVNEHLAAGSYTVKFDAGSLPSGTYVYMLTSGGHRISRKMLLAK